MINVQKSFPRPNADILPESKLNDYKHIKYLAKGTFGEVAKYQNRYTGKFYAIKKIAFKTFNKKQSNLIRKQLKVLYQISHENIVRIIDHFEDKNAIYLITEFIQGQDLYKSILKPKKQLLMKESAKILYEICDALQALHQMNIVHRDLKLENVMMSENKVKIVDLGCSNYYGQDIDRTTITGTKSYWCPQMLNHEKHDDRLDIWCLGIIIYQITCLKSPFTMKNQQLMFNKIKALQYDIPQSINHQLELIDLFKHIFTTKQKRFRIHQVKYHPWFIKYYKPPIKNCFEKLIPQNEVINYKKYLKMQINQYRKQTMKILAQSRQIEEIIIQLKQQNELQ